MRATADSLRRFWIPGLLDVVGTPNPIDIRSWIIDEEFQIYAIPANPLVLNFAEPGPIVQAYAGEISRMSRAAAETAAGISKVSALPKSTAWAVVQWYYAAFYAAHAILRMTGRSLTQIEPGHALRIRIVAELFGFQHNQAAGLHEIRLDIQSGTLTLERIQPGSGGSHEALWQRFGEWLHESALALLATGAQSRTIQDASGKLTELASVLSTAPAQKHCWLSYVRNHVAYKHEFSAWFPYRQQGKRDSNLFNEPGVVPENADGRELTDGKGGPLGRFSDACRLIVALCYDLSVEMVERSPKRASFQKHGMVALKLLAERDL